MFFRFCLFAAFVGFSFPGTASAQNLFALYEGKTMIFKGKGISSGRSFTVRDKVLRCTMSESGLCLGQAPIFNANYALKFVGDTVHERIQLSVQDGKLAAQMQYLSPKGQLQGSVPLQVRIRK